MKQKRDIYDLWDLLKVIDTKLDRIAGQVPPVKPEPEPLPKPLPEPIEPIDYTDQYYQDISTKSEIVLESGKVYRVNTLQSFELNKKLHFKTTGKERATIYIGRENVKVWEDHGESGHLFKLLDGAEFVSKNVNWCIPPQFAITSRYTPRFFSSDRDINATWTAIVKDCDTTVMGNNGGLGMGVLHGSVGQNHVAYINFKHYGQGFADLKNTDEGCVMYQTLENVETDYENWRDFNPNFTKCKVKFTDNFEGFELNGFYGTHCAEVENPNSFHFIANQFYNRGWNNRLNLIHIDRFTFWLPSSRFLEYMVDPILSNKTKWDVNEKNTKTNIGSKVLINQIPKRGDTIQLVRDYFQDTTKRANDKIRTFGNRFIDKVNQYPIELQVGDVIEIENAQYTIIHKERGNNWNIEFEAKETSKKASQYVFSSVTLDRNLPDNLPNTFDAKVIKSNAEKLLDGRYYDAYMVYKGNSQIDLTGSEKFGDKQILHSAGLGHLSYNHSAISLWAKNVKHNGFYRESNNGKGKSLGYNMVNCQGFEGEFSDREITTDKPIPERIKQLL